MGTFATTRLLATQLYGVSTADPLTLATVIVASIAVAALACYIPAREAAKSILWWRYEANREIWATPTPSWASGHLVTSFLACARMKSQAAPGGGNGLHPEERL